MTDLLNSIWQGAALTAIVWILLKLLPHLSAATRYGIWWITLLAVALLPLRPLLQPTTTEFPRPVAVANSAAATVTLAQRVQHRFLTAPVAIAHASRAVPVTITNHSPAQQHVAFKLPSQLITRIVISAWLCLSSIFLIRLAFAWRALHRLKRFATEPSPALLVQFNRITNTRSARLLISDEIATPLALGFVHPAILIPRSVADQSEPDEFRHMALHELAHLARFDDWTNLFQQILIALFPIQPALFWIGRHLNLEREAACDDRVIAITAAPKNYAASLTHIAELALWARGTLLATGVASSRSQLYRRIHRLLDRRRAGKTSLAPLPFLAAMITIVWLFSLSFSAPRLIALADTAPSTANNSNSPTPTPEIQMETLPATPGTQTRTFDVPPGDKFALDIDLGNVTIGAWSQNQARIEITQEGPGIQNFLRHHQISLGKGGNTIAIHASGDGSITDTKVHIEYKITLPANFDIQLKNEAGNLDLSGITGTLAASIVTGNIDASSCGGTLTASTSNGNVDLHAMTAAVQANATNGNVDADECHGPLTLETRNGNVECSKTAGDVTAKTRNGNVESDAAAGALDAEAHMGNVEIRHFAGTSVNAQTSMGNVEGEIDAAPTKNCSLVTSMGNVELQIIGTAAVTLKISRPVGNLDSDIPAGPFNGGGPEIRVATKMGNVSISRK